MPNSSDSWILDQRDPCDLGQRVTPPTPATLDRVHDLERRLEEVQQALTHAHRLSTLGTIASVVAHEYNNILTPVISYAQLALESQSDPDLMHKAVEKALAGAQRASRISSSLLGFAGSHEGEKAAPLSETVGEAMSCLARDPAKDGIELEVDVPEIQVAMPPLHLQQIVVNLVLNARKAMHRHGGRLTVRGEVADHAIYLDVEDTGPGVPERIRNRLFEPFVTEPIEQGGTGGGGANGAEKGTGLGLSICRDLAEQAGGRLEFTTETGSGTRFRLVLRRAAIRTEAA